MSDHSHVITLPEPERFDTNRSSGLFGITAGVAVVAFVILAITVTLGRNNPALIQQFSYSWLFGFLFFFTICAGSLFWIIVHYATDACWSVVVRRQLENVAALFPFLAVLFVPLILFRERIWQWMSIVPGTDHLFDSKIWYFYPTINGVTVPVYWIRLVFYAVFFIGAAWTFRTQSVRQDKTGDPKTTIRLRGKSFWFLPLFALSITFAAIDWVMALDYKWYSTMWGVYIFAGSAGSSMAMLVLIVTLLKSKGYLQVVNLEHYHIMGKWLFVFTIFWAYIGFSQYMLIWYANIPEETSYFLLRNTESWNILSTFLVVGHFFIPFTLLLNRWIKKKPAVLSIAAIWILCMHLLDLYIIVLPNIHREGFAPSWLDFLCPIAIGSVLVLGFLWQIGKRSLFPARDPRLLESLRLTN
ncbi:MAG TPA: hypothetical protein VIT91_19545 [Chthoniobacterales bacterium]